MWNPDLHLDMPAFQNSGQTGEALQVVISCTARAGNLAAHPVPRAYGATVPIDGIRFLAMKIRRFLIAIWSDWLTKMSGPATVPLTIAAFFVSNVAYKKWFAVLAGSMAIVTSYRVWVHEYERAEAEIAKNQKPDIKGEIIVAFSGIGKIRRGVRF